MRYRNMKTGQERDFVPGMKINSLWKPIQNISRFARDKKATVSLVEVHPEDIRQIEQAADEPLEAKATKPAKKAKKAK